MGWGTGEFVRLSLGEAICLTAAGPDVDRLPGAALQPAPELHRPAVRNAVRAERSGDGEHVQEVLVRVAAQAFNLSRRRHRKEANMLPLVARRSLAVASAVLGQYFVFYETERRRQPHDWCTPDSVPYEMAARLAA